MICLKHSPTVIYRALCIFSSIISQRLNKISQKKAGRAVHRFLVIHWLPSFHPQLLFYWTSLHSNERGSAVMPSARDPPAPHWPSMGEQWQHQHHPTNTPSASRWPTGLFEKQFSLPRVLCSPLQWTLQQATMPAATSLVLLLCPDRPRHSVCLRNKGIDYQLRLSPTKANCEIREHKF